MEPAHFFLGFPQWLVGFTVLLVPFSSLLGGGIDQLSHQIRTSCSSWSRRAKQSAVPRVWEGRRGEVLMFVSRSVSRRGSPRGSWSRYPPPPPHLYPAPSHSLLTALFIAQRRAVSQEQCIPSPWNCHHNMGVGWGIKTSVLLIRSLPTLSSPFLLAFGVWCANTVSNLQDRLNNTPSLPSCQA